MKKQIATFGLLLTCVSCSIHLKAQTTSPIHVGLKAGGTFSKVSISDNFQGKYNFGYQAGAMVRLDLGSAYLQGETLFNKRKSTLSKDNANADLSWNSIDLPVTIGYKIVKTEDVNVRAFAGGVYSYSFGKEISGKEDIEKAFKYVSRMPNKKGFITIHFIDENQKVKLLVENSFADFVKPSKNVSGIGLQNVKKRLNLIYPSTHQLQISTEKQVFKVVLTINLLQNEDN